MMPENRAIWTFLEVKLAMRNWISQGAILYISLWGLKKFVELNRIINVNMM